MTQTAGKPWKVRIVRTLLIVFTVVGLIIAYGWWQWSSEPGYWKRNQAYLASTEPPQLDRLAEDLEKRVPMEVSRIDVGRTESVRVTFDEVNAWLARRMKTWLDYQGLEIPEYAVDPMAAPDGDRLVLAIRYSAEDADQVLSLVVDVDVLEDGRCRVQFVKARGGRLSLPVGAITDRLGLDTYSDAIEYVGGSEPSLLFDPLFPIDQARHARLVDFVVDEQAVTLVIRTERQ